MKIIEPRDIYLDTEATHFEEKWWHKFIFWKKYIYPKWSIKTKRISIELLKRNKIIEEKGN